VSAAERAERLALAVLAGTVTAADARGDLSLALRESEAERSAAALRAYRSGRPVWSWPAAAPWAGF
jgi:hypothetical protein